MIVARSVICGTSLKDTLNGRSRCECGDAQINLVAWGEQRLRRAEMRTLACMTRRSSATLAARVETPERASREQGQNNGIVVHAVTLDCNLVRRRQPKMLPAGCLIG